MADLLTSIWRRADLHPAAQALIARASPTDWGPETTCPTCGQPWVWLASARLRYRLPFMAEPEPTVCVKAWCGHAQAEESLSTLQQGDLWASALVFDIVSALTVEAVRREDARAARRGVLPVREVGGRSPSQPPRLTVAPDVYEALRLDLVFLGDPEATVRLCTIGASSVLATDVWLGVDGTLAAGAWAPLG